MESYGLPSLLRVARQEAARPFPSRPRTTRGRVFKLGQLHLRTASVAAAQPSQANRNCCNHPPDLPTLLC